MSRGPLAFTAPELSRFLLDAKLLGADRLMHLERFRRDPMLTTTAGIDGLPSGKTMGVYLKQFEPGHLQSLDRFATRVFHHEWRRHFAGHREVPVVLDYDTSTLTVYGRQEGADRGRCFRKKDKPGFQPKFAFVGGLGLMVHQRIEPQSHNLNMGFFDFHRETLAKLPNRAKVWGFRADGGLYDFKIVRYLEKQGLTYGITAARTADLHAAIAAIPEQAWHEGTDEEGRIFSVARIPYCPKTWDKKLRTYVISRRLKKDTKQGRLLNGEQYTYFAYVTDFPGTVEEQFRFCVERCSLESFIKEAKGAFTYQFLPCAELSANRAYLLHVQLAYNLAIFFKLVAAPPAVNRWTIQTLRDRILCICGNLVRRAGRWILSLPTWWPYQTVFRQMQRRCAAVLNLRRRLARTSPRRTAPGPGRHSALRTPPQARRSRPERKTHCPTPRSPRKAPSPGTNRLSGGPPGEKSRLVGGA